MLSGLTKQKLETFEMFWQKCPGHLLGDNTNFLPQTGEVQKSDARFVDINKQQPVPFSRHDFVRMKIQRIISKVSVFYLNLFHVPNR